MHKDLRDHVVDDDCGDDADDSKNVYRGILMILSSREKVVDDD